MIPDRRGATVVCSSTSVSRWWRQFFSGEVGSIIEWPNGSSTNSVEGVMRQIDLHGTRNVLVLSEHRTLERDAILVDKLRRLGHLVAGADSEAARFELDKLAAKSRFERAGIPSPRWSSKPLPSPPFLEKPIRGTETEGVRWARSDDTDLQLRASYYEEYVSGTEYSVIVVKSPTGALTLPPVWKGRTQADLTPPYRRLRLCGPGLLEPSLERSLGTAALDAAALIAGPCILEVEFVKSIDGRLLVLEINPRIAGTTRMASLAADCPFLDSCLQTPASSDRHSIFYTAELPVVRAGSISILNADVYATSRLTVRGSSLEEVRGVVRKANQLGWLLDESATAMLHDASLREDSICISVTS